MLNSLSEIEQALAYARHRHPNPYHSVYEWYGVARSEWQEWWKEIDRKEHKRDKAKIRSEAIQIAAVMVRGVEDLLNDG